MDLVSPVDGSETEGGQNDTLRVTPLGDKAARATFLAIFVIIGFVGNSVLIATIAQSQRLKLAVLNLFIISIASVNVVDTLINMTLILGSSISEKWNFGSFVCQLNAFGVQFVSIVMIMGLMLMSLDRLVAVSSVEKYRVRVTVMKANIGIIIKWVYGIALSIPVVAGAIPTAPAYSRYLCSITKGASVIYITFLSIFGYLIPAMTTLILYILIILSGRKRIKALEIKPKEKRKQKKMNTEPDADDLPDLWDEVDAAKFVGVLFILWCICVGPYLLIVTIEEFAFSDQVNSSITYPWQLELSFAWMRFGYVIVLPILTIFWRNDFRMRVKHCLLCKKMSNSSSDYNRDQRGVGTAAAADTPNLKQKKEQKENGSVPVLYVTAEGLGLQIAERNSDLGNAVEVEPSEIEANMNSDAMSSPNTTTTKCDVFGSQVNLQEDQEDTSDFEEEDPLAVSNAQSVRSRSSHGSRSSVDKNGHSTLTKPNGRSKKEDGKTKMKNETYIVEKPSKNKRRSAKLEKVEDEADGEDGNMSERISKRERNDSGRGSLERPESKVNQQEKKRKKKQTKDEQQKLSKDIERVLGDTVTEYNGVIDKAMAVNVELEGNNEEGEYTKVKKKKKKRKKREEQVAEQSEDVDAGYVNAAMDIEDPEIGIDNLQNTTVDEEPVGEEEMGKTESARSAKVLFTKVPMTPEKRSNVRPLPHLPKQKQKTHIRAFSDDFDVDSANNNSTGPDNKSSHGRKKGKSHHRSVSEDWDMNDLGEAIVSQDGKVPTPVPRKSKSKYTENQPSSARKMERFNSHRGAEVQLEGSDWSDSEYGEKTGSKVTQNHKPRKVRQSEI